MLVPEWCFFIIHTTDFNTFTLSTKLGGIDKKLSDSKHMVANYFKERIPKLFFCALHSQMVVSANVYVRTS